MNTVSMKVNLPTSHEIFKKAETPVNYEQELANTEIADFSPIDMFCGTLCG